MTVFTWARGRTGASGASADPAVIAVSMAQYPPGTPTTVRRMIIDWGIDLQATDKTGSTNSTTPITLGIISTTTSDGSKVPPTTGPATEPNGWNWWQGCWFGNGYGVATTGAFSGFFDVSGRIDRQTPLEMDPDVYTTWWLVAEVENSAAYWSKFYVIPWWQILTAPTLA